MDTEADPEGRGRTSTTVGDPLLARLEPRHYRDVARMLLTDPVFGWVESGEDAVSDNRGAFERYRFSPRMLRDVGALSTASTILGTPVSAPIGVAPIGIQGALHPDGERATVAGVAAAGSVLIVPVNSTTDIGDVANAAPDAPLWLQLYNWPDREALQEVAALAEAAGCRAIVPLVNTPVLYPHAPARLGFGLPAGMSLAHGAARHAMDATLDWSFIEWLASITRLPIVPKGIVRPDDALRALDSGAAAILVSNHGNRQLPRSIATLDALPEVVAAVGGRAEVYLDGGVRTGSDVLIALALGARAVFVARSVCWGLAVGGAEGVTRVLDTLRAELAREAATCGIRDLARIPDDLLVRAG